MYAYHLYFASLRGCLRPLVPKSMARGNSRAAWCRAFLRDRAAALSVMATTNITDGLSPTHVPSKVSALVVQPQGNREKTGTVAEILQMKVWENTKQT